MQCEIILSGSGKSLSLLKNEFPDLQTFELPNHKLKFSEKRSINSTVVLQARKLNRAIKEEQNVLKKFLKTNPIDGSISDNRYGICSENIPSVLMTHQISLSKKTPFRFFGQLILNKQLSKFNEIWIPDEQGSLLSGELSKKNNPKKKYIGALSRFQNLNLQREKFILILASGTEPHRTQFEEKIVSELGGTNYSCILLRGLPDQATSKKKFPSNFKVHAHLKSSELNELISSAALVISRNGYTTMMDVFKTKTPAVLIKTEGQAEQEYLAEHLTQTLNYNTQTISEFNLTSLENAKVIGGDSTIDLQEKLRSWLHNL